MVEAIVFFIAAMLPSYGFRFKVGPFPSTVLEVVILASIAALVYWIYFKKYAPTEIVPVGNGKLFWTATALILAASVVGIFVAPDRLAALGIARAYFWEPIALFALVVRARPNAKKLFNAALYGFAANALTITAYGVFQYFFPSLIPATYAAERRITSFYSYPNAIALYLAPLTPLFFASPVTAPLAALTLIAILLAQSTGGLIAVAAAVFFLGLSFRKTRVAVIVLAVFAGAALFFAPQLGGLREQVLMQDWSGRVHRIGWEESWAMLREHPVFGAGISGYPTVVKPYHTAQGVEIFQYPHNLFLAIWSELGILGLAGFLLLLVWFFRTTLKRRTLHDTRYKLLAAAMVAVLVHGLVDVPYFKNDLSAAFWILMAITAIMNKEYGRTNIGK